MKSVIFAHYVKWSMRTNTNKRIKKVKGSARSTAKSAILILRKKIKEEKDHFFQAIFYLSVR